MCDKIKLPLLSPRSWSWGSGRGKFSPNLLPPTDLNSLLMDADYDDLCDMLDVVEESEKSMVTAQPAHDIFDDVFINTAADDCISVSEDSVATNDTPDSQLKIHVPGPPLFCVEDHRRSAIERWRVKKSKQKGLVKVCKARSEVALNRPRVKGKFVKKAQFVSVTDLQGY